VGGEEGDIRTSRERCSGADFVEERVFIRNTLFTRFFFYAVYLFTRFDFNGLAALHLKQQIRYANSRYVTYRGLDLVNWRPQTLFSGLRSRNRVVDGGK
jgi:hypothetical protein